jgi:2-polyprenyl-6-methoxyphenol hydroxylase-like FAD-dependent oxidoreductase
MVQAWVKHNIEEVGHFEDFLLSLLSPSFHAILFEEIYLNKKEGTLMITKNSSILISGASIAGPALAYWLKRYGFTPTVIERAPHLRAGGYPIDVRYEAVTIAQRMGIWPRLQQEKPSFGEISFVNERNERIGSVNGQAVRQTFDLDVVEIMRGDLAKILYELTKDEVEYCFGDSIQALKQD